MQSSRERDIRQTQTDRRREDTISADEDAPLSTTAFELQRIWREGNDTCGICRVVGRDVARHIDALFYENVNDAPTRDTIRRAGGFCRYHAGAIIRQGDALGTAIILRDVLTAQLRSIGEAPAPAPGGLLKFAQVFKDEGEDTWQKEIKCRPCPICDAERDITATVIAGLLRALRDAEFAALFTGSARLCVGHYNLTMARADTDRRSQVREVMIRTLRDITGRLAELARKHDYRFADEPQGEEMRSWRTALNISSSWIEE